MDLSTDVPYNFQEYTTEHLILLKKKTSLHHMKTISFSEISAEIIIGLWFSTPGNDSNASVFARTMMPLLQAVRNVTILWNNQIMQSTFYQV